MTSWERRLVWVCRQLKCNTRRINRDLESFFAWADGKGELVSRNLEPDRLLNPKLNGTCPLLTELGACLKHFLPEEMSKLGIRALASMVDECTSFIEELEGYVRMRELCKSTTVEIDIFSYMSMMPTMPTNRREHEKKIDRKLAVLKESFYQNSNAIYDVITKIKEQKRPKKSRRKSLERKVDILVETLTRDEVKRTFCWDTLSAARARQVRAVWEWMQNEENRQHPNYGLSFACNQAFISVCGGYPTDRALYNFCHAHASDFL